MKGDIWVGSWGREDDGKKGVLLRIMVAKLTDTDVETGNVHRSLPFVEGRDRSIADAVVEDEKLKSTRGSS